MFRKIYNNSNFSKAKLQIGSNDFLNLINLSTGLYSPLDKFCNLKECNSIIHKKKYKKIKWTLPILLNNKNKKKLEKNKKYFLFYRKKRVGFINFESSFKINKKLYTKRIFNTCSKKHPSVKRFFDETNSYISGKVYMDSAAFPKDNYFILNNKKILKKIRSKKYISFSTRNVCHLGHEHILRSLNKNKFNFLIFFIQSENNKYNPNTVIKSYKILFKKKLFSGSMIFKIFMPTLMAGPREAYLQATMLNNLKLKNFIVGRDHAGFSNFFSKYSSQEIFKNKSNLKIRILKTKEPLMCNLCNRIGSEFKKICNCKKKRRKLLTIDGRKIRYLIKSKRLKELSKYLDPKIFRHLVNK